MDQRLQKILSAGGVCSRRKAEEYLREGRVTVNGVPAALGDKADPETDTIALDGVPVGRTETRTLLMLYKPRGVVTTLADEKGRRTVADLVKDCGARVWPVGRLDLDSEGLLLLTDDGALTNALLHPSQEVEKEYLVWVKGYRTGAEKGLERPMTLDGQALHPAQVRRMCAHCGLTVTRLKRVREGKLPLDPALAPGQWRPLTAAETALLEREISVQD